MHLNRCCNLREVKLNDGLQKIGVAAFHDCKLLEYITLPSTLLEIGHSAFRSCSNLREVIFSDGLQKIGVWAFRNCSLENIKLPATITEIGNRSL